MKKLITILSLLCIAAGAESLSLHLDHYIPNFSAPNVANVNLVVLSVSNAVPGASDTLLMSTDQIHWTPVATVIAPGQTYSTSALMPVNVTNAFFKLMEARP